MKPNTLVAIVTTGDRIPWDGKVVDGFAMVDESAVTGVSKPQMLEASEGREAALAGSLIVDGWLKIESDIDARMYVPTDEDRQRKKAMNGELDFEPRPIDTGPSSSQLQLVSAVIALATLAIIVFCVLSK